VLARFALAILAVSVALGMASGQGAPAAATPAAAGTYCGQSDTVPVDGGQYNLQTNEWNSSASQCLSTSGNADFTVTQSAIQASTSSSPGSYPSLYVGCHWGTCTSGGALPIQLMAMGDPTSSWSTTQTGTGAYDVSYDLWFNLAPSTGGAPDGGELMIWLNSHGRVQPSGSRVGTADLDGYQFEVWSGQGGDGSDTTYVMEGGASSVTNLDLGNIVRNAELRGYLFPTSYLISVESGFELWNGGTGLATNSFSFSSDGPAPPPTSPSGYCLVASDGGIFSFGDAGYFGSAGSKHLNEPIVGMAPTPDGKGYWLVASDGGIFSFGDAGYFGSAGSEHLNEPIVGMAATPDGKGYWLVASDGGIFSFGDARFYGSTGGISLKAPIVGMAADPATGGYWLVASDGGIFSYNAPFAGSMGGRPLNTPIVAMAADPATGGYWLVASDGGIFSFGVPFDGSMGGRPLNRPIVGMTATADGGGYRFVASDGGIFSFGDARFYGSMGGRPLNATIVGMAATT
jgi:hypothetical protein